MWQGFTIALREGIEVLPDRRPDDFLPAADGPRELARAVYPGIGVSVVVLRGLPGSCSPKAANQPLWEGILALAAAALVGSLLVYMKRISSST